MILNRIGSFFLVLLLVAPLAWAQLSAEEWTPRSPLLIATSLHSYVNSESKNKINTSLDPNCVKAIQSHLKAGGDFYSSQMDDPQNSSLFEDHPAHSLQARYVYHYSKSEVLRGIAENGKYDEIFSYLRYTGPGFFWHLFVAGDNRSSSAFGSHLVEFKLSRSTKIFYPHGRSNHSEGYSESLILQELLARIPNLKLCEKTTGDPINPNFLVLLAAESSRINLIAYAGVGNRFWPIRGSYNWMLLLNGWSIESSRYVNDKENRSN